MGAPPPPNSFKNLFPILVRIPTEVIDPCNPSPCGSNANCQQRNRAASCQCIPDYFGDPYVACRPECVVNSDCPSNKACQQNHCIDPCPGTCGVNAECRVQSHIPSCTCIRGYIGDPFTACRRKPSSKYQPMSHAFCCDCSVVYSYWLLHVVLVLYCIAWCSVVLDCIACNLYFSPPAGGGRTRSLRP